MTNKFLVFVEQRDGQIKKSSLEVVNQACKSATELNADVEVVIIGDAIDNLQALGNYGINKVTHLKNTDLANYSVSAYSKLLLEFAQETDANLIMFANTAMGKDLAPYLAIKLNAAIATDCVELSTSDDKISVTKPVYAGKALTKVEFNSEKVILTLRPNVFTIGDISDTNAEVVVNEVSDLNFSNKVTDVSKASGTLDVAEASIVVSGGRGLKAPENFGMIEELASLLGAATGASRAAVDAGWRPHSHQVGQTGKTVSPNLYIAVGISGAIQHLAGMRSSKYIVAINKDKDAPIFGVADYGIAGDAFEVVPALIEELKKD